MRALLLTLLLAPACVRSERVCQSDANNGDTWARMLDTSLAQQSLKDHTAQVSPKEIIQISSNIWLALGYGLSNSVVIKGDDGMIIIDTMDSDAPAREVLPIFQNLTRNADGSTLPVSGIIYTHNHPDHISGAHIFAGAAAPDLQVWAHANLVDEFWDKWQYNRPMLMARGVRQVGAFLPQDVLINSGLGIKYVLGKETGLLLVPPTNVLEGASKDISISGVNMRLVYIPGETRDQMGIYFPDQKVFVAGDDYYHTFPNLYAIRGTPPRPVQEWMQSVQLMIDMDIDILLPIHTRPVYGADIRERLQDYRDAIQYVNDQTIRYMNKGFHPNEVAELVKLPESLRSKNYLQEHYGGVEWSVKTVFEGQMGWFSGLPEDLYPLTPSQLGCRTLELIGSITNGASGGSEKCKNQPTALERGRCYSLEEAILISEKPDADTSEEDLRWGMTVVSHVINCDTSSYLSGAAVGGFIAEAKKIRANVGIRLANRQPSPNGRNYLLTYVIEENCIGPTSGINPNANDMAVIMLLPFDRIFDKLATLLKAEDLDGVHKTVVVVQPDGTTFTLSLRNSVLQVLNGAAQDFDLKVSFVNGEGETYFRAVLAKQMPVEQFLTLPVYNIEGDYSIEEFFNWFDDPNLLPVLPYLV